jgi:hypothetical protein
LFRRYDTWNLAVTNTLPVGGAMRRLPDELLEPTHVALGWVPFVSSGCWTDTCEQGGGVRAGGCAVW